MSEVLAFDARGRITIPTKLRKHVGKNVVAILTPRGILLHKVPRHAAIGVSAKAATGEDAALAEV